MTEAHEQWLEENTCYKQRYKQLIFSNNQDHPMLPEKPCAVYRLRCLHDFCSGFIESYVVGSTTFYGNCAICKKPQP